MVEEQPAPAKPTGDVTQTALAALIPDSQPDDVRQILLEDLVEVRRVLKELLPREAFTQVERPLLELCVAGWVRRAERFDDFLERELPKLAAAGEDHRPLIDRLNVEEAEKIRADVAAFCETHLASVDPQTLRSVAELLSKN